MNTSDKIIVECDCGTHLLRTEFEDNLFSIAFYTFGNGGTNIWSRIKYAFIHIFTGRMYSDQMIINKKEAKKLVEFINEKLETNI